MPWEAGHYFDEETEPKSLTYHSNPARHVLDLRTGCFTWHTWLTRILEVTVLQHLAPASGTEPSLLASLVTQALVTTLQAAYASPALPSYRTSNLDIQSELSALVPQMQPS